MQAQKTALRSLLSGIKLYPFLSVMLPIVLEKIGEAVYI